MLLNVNMPNLPFDVVKGIRSTRLGRRMSAEPVIEEMSPRGFPIYWLGAAGTPLQIDLTAHREVERTGRWLAGDLSPKRD